MSSSRYDNLGGGAIEVISPASSPVQPQQDKSEDRQQQAAGGKHFPFKDRFLERLFISFSGKNNDQSFTIFSTLYIKMTYNTYETDLFFVRLIKCSCTQANFSCKWRRVNTPQLEWLNPLTLSLENGTIPLHQTSHQTALEVIPISYRVDHFTAGKQCCSSVSSPHPWVILGPLHPLLLIDP